MATNDLSFNQLSTVLNSILGQVTGKTALITNTTDFVSVGQTVLKSGYDPVLGAISQTLSKTVFSNRPYTAKFRGLQVSNQKFGNMTRKLNIADKDWVDDDRINLSDGTAVDMYKVNKPSMLQTNFYGANVFERYTTIFKDQLDCAFNSPEEFNSFLNMQMGNASDLIEQAHENLARATVANFIGGKILGDTGSVVHLLTEYNALTGLALTATTVYLPANFTPFIQWAYARIGAVSSLMTERSRNYHINVTGKEISRHTPQSNQKLYVLANTKYQIENMVMPTVFNSDKMKLADNETVNFWQAIGTPDSINIKPTYLKNDGTLITATTALQQSKVFAVLFDEEAMGYTTVNQWSAPTPFNASGGYTNIFWHFTDRYWNDYTENGVVFTLD